jgi:NADH dehydrogenase
MYLIVGATGNLGGAVTRLLLAQGKHVRILARTQSNYQALAVAGAEVAFGDLTDAPSLSTACTGVTTVFDAAHSLLGRGNTQSQRVDGEGKKQLIDAAKAAGVEHFVFTSLRGAAANHPVDFCRTKYVTEQYLRRSGLAFTILRPTAYFIPHATLIGEPLLKRGKTTIFGQGNNPRNFVAISDVAQIALRVLTEAKSGKDVIEVGGPENLTSNQVAALYARIAGIEPKITHVPRVVLRVMASLLKPVHPGISSVMRWALYSDTADERFDPTPTLQLYPISLTRLEEWIRVEWRAIPAGMARQAA